jgi:hypothetical protein
MVSGFGFQVSAQPPAAEAASLIEKKPLWNLGKNPKNVKLSDFDCGSGFQPRLTMLDM